MHITAAVVISVVSACLAFAAWRTSREKLRLDLYNRRFDIYSRTLDLLHALENWHPSELEKNSTSLQQSPELEQAQRAFVKASREAQFLFDDASGIPKLLEQMHADVIAMIGFKRDIVPKLRGEAFIAENQKFTERLSRVYAVAPLLEKGMKKYLDFRTLSAWSFW
jgi:hypothetical protein